AQLVDDYDSPAHARGFRLSRGFFRDPLISDRALSARFAAATEELLSSGGNSLQAAERLSEVLRVIFQRYAGVRDITDRPPAANSRVSRVRDLLEARYSEDLTVADVAQVAGMSRVHTTRQFTVTYGIPPHAYLNQVRIRHAKRLLLEGVPAAQVAVDV